MERMLVVFFGKNEQEKYTECFSMQYGALQWGARKICVLEIPIKLKGAFWGEKWWKLNEL